MLGYGRRFREAVFVACVTTHVGCTPAPGPQPGEVAVELDYELPSTCNEITLSAHHDTQGKPFLYVAAKDGGLRVYDVSGVPRLVVTIPSSLLGSLDAMNLSQHGSLLYVALGNTFGTDVQATGMAIIDVVDPSTASITALWRDTSLTGGTGIAVANDSFAYLGAMRNGVIIFDVRNPAQPQELSRFVPPIDFPDASPDPAKINARGMQVIGNTVYLAYDAGGVRILDVSAPTQPKEVGRYSNPVLNGKPRAYNNVIVDGTLAYVAADYCGVEVLDVADPGNIKQLAWSNPWSCETNPLNWFSSDGHANELALDSINKLLFVSTGKSDLEILDVSMPSSPVPVGGYGGVDNGIGTWGVSIHDSHAFLSYTCAVVPFQSNWTGVKAIRYTRAPSP